MICNGIMCLFQSIHTGSPDLLLSGRKMWFLRAKNNWKKRKLLFLSAYIVKLASVSQRGNKRFSMNQKQDHRKQTVLIILVWIKFMKMKTFYTSSESGISLQNIWAAFILVGKGYYKNKSKTSFSTF